MKSITSMKIIVGAILIALALIFASDANAVEYTCDDIFTEFVAGQVVPMEDNVFVFCFPTIYTSGVALEADREMRGRITINGEVFESKAGLPGELGIIAVPGYIQLANEADIAICDTKCSEVTRISGTFHSGIPLPPGQPVPAVH